MVQEYKKNIAVIGTSILFPEADSLDQFYLNLREGRNSVRPLTKSRADASYIDFSKSYLITGHMDKIDAFDHKFFNISKREADYMHPSQRNLLQLACAAIENAGYALDHFKGSNTSVYIGVGENTDYKKILPGLDPTIFTGNMGAMEAGRIAYHLDLNGPAMTIDTTCSSALVAIHEACNKLITEEVDYALAGGIYLIISFPELTAGMDPLGVISLDGISKAFDADANGTGGGEGGGMLLLKRLDKAMADHDPILGVIKGSAVNHDGKRSSGITVPSPEAQTDVIQKAWKRANVDPETITFIEAHGTGTKLGDPIEFLGITEAFKAFTPKKKICAVSSVKTNLGHLNNAAGVAGIVKCLVSLQHQEYFPSLHFHHPNPYIDFDNSAAYINTELKKWETHGTPRRCGVSSFGLSGTNAHVVLEEAPVFKKESYTPPELFLKVAAKTPHALKRYLQDIYQYLSSKSNHQIGDMLYTLNSGRNDYPFRIGMYAEDTPKLLEGLHRHIEDFDNLSLQPVGKRKVMVLLSDGITDEGTVQSLKNKYLAFQEAYDMIITAAAADGGNPRIQCFAAQFALTKLWQSLGVPVSTVIATGAGKITKQVITDELPVTKAVEILRKEENLHTPLDESKFYQVVEKFVKDDHTLFIAWEQGCSLFQKLGEWKATLPEIQAIQLIDPAPSVLPTLAAAYQLGVDIDWKTFYNPGFHKGKYYRVPAPTYPFEKISCWVKPVKETVSKTVEKWFYGLKWVPQDLTTSSVIRDQTFLVFKDQFGLADSLISTLEAYGNKCIQVSQGKSYEQVSPIHYRIRVGQEVDYMRLGRDFSLTASPLHGILHLGAVTPYKMLTPENAEQQLEAGIYQPFLIAKAFHAYFKRNFHIAIITSFGADIQENEGQIMPTHAASQALLKGILAEFPLVKVNYIDVQGIQEHITDKAETIFKELSHAETLRFVGYRGLKRYVQQLEPQHISRADLQQKEYLQPKATYLVTGGASGIGFETCKAIARQVQPHFIILGRTVISESEADLHDGIRHRAQNLKALEALGATVDYYAVDVSDPERMAATFTHIREKVPKIHGVIHAAGLPGNWEALPNKQSADFQQTLKPKVQGTLLLDQYTQTFEPAFFVVYSSLNAVVAQKNSMDYAVANAFVDGYVTWKAGQNKRFISINWPGWYETGMSLKNGNPPPAHQDYPLKPISTQDGLQAFDDVMKFAWGNILVGEVDLHAFWVNPYFLIKQEKSEEAPSEKNTDPVAVNLQKGFTDTQAKIASIWQEILQEKEIKLEDDFFELGGHSLNGVQVINRIEQAFGIELFMEDLFDCASLEELASYVDKLVSSGKEKPAEEILSIPVRDYYEVSHAQKRLWILSKFEEDGSTYNMPGAYLMKGLKQPVFEKALATLIARHEILRTSFIHLEGVLYQKVHTFEDCDFKVCYIDLRKEHNPEEVARELAEQEAKTPFQLDRAPLLRTSLLQVEEDHYIFLFTIHHIISDGWSIRVMVEEILALYQAYLHGKANPLAPLQIQYKDYSFWQNQKLQDAALEGHRQYWLQQFDKGIPVLNLPTDRPRPAIRTFKGELHSHQIDKSLLHQLQKFAQEQGVSLYMTLLAGVYTLLYRYTSQRDIVIGSPIAGRDHKALENQIGCYLNNLALRLQFEDGEPFEQLLGRVKVLTLQAYEHQLYPFDKLVDELNLQRDLSRSPLFDVVIAQNVDFPENIDMQLEGVEVEPYDTGFRVSMVDLRIVLAETERGLLINFDYNQDLFDADRITRMGYHLQNLLQSVVSDGKQPIDQINYLSAQEKQILLESFNETKVALPSDQTMQELFEAQAALYPEQVALAFDNRKMTYHELNQTANQLAHYLRGQVQVKPNDIIGIRLHRSEQVIISILGILKAGAAYVPIDPTYPLDRVHHVLNDAAVKVLITESDLLYELGDYQGELFAVDIQLDGLDTSRENPSVVNTPTDLAYVIYTSGSTGLPKGVMLEHQNNINIILDHVHRMQVTPDDKILQLASISFDVSVCEIFTALYAGSTLVLMPAHLQNDIEHLHQYMEAQEVSICMMPASFYSILDQERLKKLRVLIIGGETVNVEKASYSSQFTECINAYGPTECSICVSAYHLDPAKVHKTGIPIGRPIANTQLYVLDEKLQPVPVGVDGEICVSGAGLARGYLNNDPLTAAKFVNHPFRPGERLYRTGDIGRWLADGNILFQGRKDRQVKIRGYRIELGELEQVLSQYEPIKETVVRPNENHTQLIAYYTANSALENESIQGFLQKKLPEYMLPSHYIYLENIPLTKHGKVDFKALPLPEQTEAYRKKQYIPPQNAIEKKLVALWEEVLGKKQIGILDNFFELGGHSLKATQLVTRIHKEMDAKIELGNIFSNPTIQEIAQLIVSGNIMKFKAIELLAPQAYYEVSHAQKRLWLLQQFEENQMAYNIPMAYWFEGSFPIEYFKKVFYHLIARHEILRTTFPAKDGQPRQKIHAFGELPIAITCKDIQGIPAQESFIDHWIREDSLKSFDLEKGPLVRASVLQTDVKKFLFTLTMHHIISDGRSMEILSREMTRLYNAYVCNEEVSLSPLPIQYKEYAHWQNHQLREHHFEPHQQYWWKQLEGELPVLQLPMCRPRPAVKTFNGDFVKISLPPSQVATLKQTGLQQEASLFMTLVVCVYVLLHKYTAQEDIIIGTTVAGREHEDLQNQIGFYVNTLAFRHTVNPKDTFAQFLSKVKSNVLQAYTYQDYPFDQLVDDLHLERDMSRSPVFDVLIELLNTRFDLHEGMKDIQVQPYPTYMPVSKYDLSFRFFEEEDTLALILEYNTDLFESETIQRLGHHFEQLIAQITENTITPIEHLQLLTESEHQKIIRFNPDELEGAEVTAFTEAFEKQVSLTPDHLAIRYGEEQWSYATLHQKAKALAAYLQENHGIAPQDIIGIMLERSANSVIALLGILKAGAVFLPIDPAYPPQRKAFMLNDQPVKALITESDFMMEVGEYYEGPLVALDIELNEDQSGENYLPVVNHPSDLAYIIYTSGSTGRPKGVGITHSNFMHYLLWANQYYFQGTSGYTFGWFTSLSFDLTFTSIFTTLLRGDLLVIFPEMELMALIQTIFSKDSGVNTLKLTPSHIPIVQELTHLADTNVSYVILGGEAVHENHIQTLKKLNPHIQIWNEYGPTETTIGCTVKSITQDSGPISIGKPIGNTQIYIVNELLQLQPIGIPGEICVGGKGVSMGYLNQAQLTREKFIDNPFTGRGKIYRTGDIGYWLPDGNIICMGRKDEQIKMRGYRVELSEIQHALSGYDTVDEVVIAVEKENLIAFVSPEQEDLSGLQAYAEKKLPAYMVPQCYVSVPRIPLTANGKADKKALLANYLATEKVNAHYEAPANETEALLVKIWEEVLERKPIGVTDHFFRMGGHSLKGVQIASRIGQQMQVKFDLGNIFAAPTIREQAVYIRQAPRAGHLSMDVIQEQEYYDVSHAQKRLWVIDQFEEGQYLYNIPYAYTVRGHINVEALSKAFETMINRHEILRTIFVNINGQPHQKILTLQEIGFQVAFTDLRQEADPEEKAKKWAQEEAQTAFDLEKGPLLRVKLLQMADDAYLFLLTIHHIISDGWSMEILIKELEILYGAYQRQQPDPLPPLQLQYKDYVYWQKQVNDENEQYWLQKLSGNIEPIHLPYDYEPSSYQTFHGDRLQLVIEAAEVSGLKEIAMNNHTTLSNVLFTLFNILLYQISRQRDLIVGLATANRNHPGLEKLIGFFINTLVIRTQISDNLDFQEILKQVTENTAEAYRHQDYPFDLLVEKLNPDRITNKQTLFNVMYAYQSYRNVNMDVAVRNEAVFEIEDPGIQTKAFEQQINKAYFDLTLFVYEQQEALMLELNYNSDLFETPTVEMIMGNLKAFIDFTAQGSKSPSLISSE